MLPGKGEFVVGMMVLRDGGRGKGLIKFGGFVGRCCREERVSLGRVGIDAGVWIDYQFKVDYGVK